MMKIGINGFSRIGRMVLRVCLANKLQVLVVNDPFLTAAEFAYLFKYDSTYGKFNGDVIVDARGFTINGIKIEVTHEKDPHRIPWQKHGVEYVIEATGVFTNNYKASLHLNSGAKCVVVASPSADLPMFVYGVNHEDYKPDMKLISSACSTTHCLAVLAKVIHENFEIVDGLMTTVHATSATQKVLDSPGYIGGGSKRDGRGALQNIIPGCTGAAKCIGHVLPVLDGKLTGMALRIPVASVSVVDLTLHLGKPTTYEEIKKRIKLASEGSMKGILSWTDDDVVSSDFIGNKYSCVLDVKAGVPLNERFVKLLAWYDNEVAYCHRIIDLIKYIDSVPKTE